MSLMMASTKWPRIFTKTNLRSLCGMSYKDGVNDLMQSEAVKNMPCGMR